MNNINIALIKELRLRTGAGFMECKRALIEENGDIESSIDNLRKLGKTQAQNKSHRSTDQGQIFINIKNNFGAMLELKCQTDFVAKDSLFIALGKEITSTALSKNIESSTDIKKYFEEKKTELILKTGENIIINRFVFIKGESVASYLHNGRIGVLVNGRNLNKDILKKIAMHIAASKPEYLSPKNVSSAFFKREYEIQLNLSKNSNKSDHILKKIVDGRMKKCISNISLTSQNFVMDPTKTVGQVIAENNGCIISFNRFEIGEIQSEFPK